MPCRFGCDRTIKNGTLLGELSTFSTVYRLLRTFSKHHTCASMRKPHNWYKLACDREITEGTLLREQRTFWYLAFYFPKLQNCCCLCVLYSWHVWLRSVNNGRQFTWRTNNLMKTPSNRRRDTVEKFLFSPSEVPFFIDRSRPKLYQMYSMRSERRDWSFGGGVTLNRRRDSDEKVLCSVNKVPFVTDRSQPNSFQL